MFQTTITIILSHVPISCKTYTQYYVIRHIDNHVQHTQSLKIRYFITSRVIKLIVFRKAVFIRFIFLEYQIFIVVHANKLMSYFIRNLQTLRNHRYPETQCQIDELLYNRIKKYSGSYNYVTDDSSKGTQGRDIITTNIKTINSSLIR